MKIPTPPKKRAVALVAVLVTVFSTVTFAPLLTLADPPPQSHWLTFISVDLNLNSAKSPHADDKLVDYLTSQAPVKFTKEKSLNYENMIRRLLDWKSEDGAYLARVTPYAFVSASMLGADLEVLATYKNPAGITIYHSYLVINRNVFPALKDKPDSKPSLEQIVEHLRDKPAQFIYHDKFSTSSYFLPTLFFRNNDIYSMPDASGSNLKAIHTEDINRDLPAESRLGSSELVKRVAADETKVAAVWDVTMKEASESEKKLVYFIPLPNELPNDLLVCFGKLDPATKKELRDSIRRMKDNQINQGDYKTWVPIEDANEARQAMGQLRHLAEQRPTAVTIKVENSQNSPISQSRLDYIKHAIRLSNTEFVPWDEDYHVNVDVDWRVETIHDGAIRLVSKIKYVNLDAQEFEISFTNDEDLAKRIGSIINSRLHRIRYVWPYEDRSPTVIRDVQFPVLPNTVFKVVKIAWNDPKRNSFYFLDRFDATVSSADRFGFQLSGSGFPNKFDPMSNTSYQVILVRDTKERGVFTGLTYVFIGLFVLAAGGAVWDMRRKKKAKEPPILNPDDFKQKCRELADKSRSFWREHKLRDADVVWCNRKSLDELIAELNAIAGNVDFAGKIIRKRSLAILAHIPVVSKFVNLQAGAGLEVINEIDPTKFGDTKRLGLTIQYLVNQNAFSEFVGEKLEWDALDEMTTDMFKPFRIEKANLNGNGNGNGETTEIRPAARRKSRRTSVSSRRRISRAVNNGNVALISSEHPMILSAVATHLDEVIEQSKERVCFFGKNWQVKKNRTVIHLACSAQLQSPLQLNGSKSTVSKLTLQAEIPRNAKTDEFAKSEELSAWLFGKVIDVGRNGSAKTLLLTFETTALVRTDDPE
jgi:hypothetical protein